MTVDLNDLPPVYIDPSHPSTQQSCHVVPVYTESAHYSERVLSHSSSPSAPIPGPSSHRGRGHCGQYVYNSDHFEVNLGSSPWGTLYSAYGREGTIKGVLNITKKFAHVSHVTVKFRGDVVNRVSEHVLVAVPAVGKRPLVSRSVCVFSSTSGTTLEKQKLDFSIPIPEHMDGEDVPLPPSASAFHPGVVSDVEYTIQVHIVRKALWRHESIAIPILYLPKSRPSVPPVPDNLFLITSLLDPRLRQFPLSPLWPKGEDPKTKSTTQLPSVTLFVPDCPNYASGTTVPVALHLQCLHNPALSRILAPNVSVVLVKRTKIWLNAGRQISVRERPISSVDEFCMRDLEEGSRFMMMNLPLGQAGCESSWKVEGSVENSYLIRAIVRPPAYAKNVPMFRVDASIEITTDQYGTLRHELLAMGGVPTPALGLTTIHPSIA